SSTASRAVSIRIGASEPSWRSRRQVSNPSMPGRLTSSTRTSYGVEPAIHSASSPVIATSARTPCSCRALRISAASLTSSSTTSTLTAAPRIPQASVGRLGLVPHALHGFEDRLAGILGLDDRGVAGLLEHLAYEVVRARERELDDDGAVGELLRHRALLARPAGAVGGDPHARDPRGLDLAGARPALEVGARLDLRARRVLLGQHLGLADAVQPEVADRLLGRVVRGDVPALAAVDQVVGLDRARRVLVLVLLVVVEAHQPAALDRLRHDAGDLRVV